MIKRYLLILMFSLISCVKIQAQEYQLKLFVQDGVAHMQINNAQKDLIKDSILASCGFIDIDLNSAALNLTSNLKWTISKVGNSYIELTKPLIDFKGTLNTETALIFKEFSTIPAFAKSTQNFGYNPSTIFHIRTLNNGLTRFELNGFKEAKEVILSGSFVNWSTVKLPMTKSTTGWQIDIDIPDGVHTYKFIVDGNWLIDPQNSHNQNDGFGNVNSVYVKTNFTFKLEGHLDARKVILTGSFNNWNEREIKMKKTLIGWEMPVYLKDGTYPYKFIVDGDWITDPANPDKRKDALGNTNSFASVGEPALFVLNNHTQAHQIILSGSFNNWSEHELVMTPKKNHWELKYVIAPGNYEYKYIVDGRWYLPNDCQITCGENDVTNCVLVLEPNYTFKLKGHQNAREVRLSGSFNNWRNPGYTMRKTTDGWEISLHLDPGKYSYQFVVDGVWTPDPQNAEFETNEFGGKNSVMWLGL